MSALEELRSTVREVYEDLGHYMDWACEQSIREGKTVQCKKGCAACCYLVTTCSIPEVIHLLMTTKENGHEDLILQRMPEIAGQFKEILKRETTCASWHNAQHRCIFLGDDNLCVAYEARPMVCRVYYVLSDPAKCSPPTNGTTAVNAREHLEIGIPRLIWAAHRIGMPLCYAPLQFLVPVVLELLEDGREAALRFLDAHDSKADLSDRWIQYG